MTPEEKREYMKAWNQRNRARVQAYRAKRYVENAEMLRKQSRDYKEANREEVNRRNREYMMRIARANGRKPKPPAQTLEMRREKNRLYMEKQARLRGVKALVRIQLRDASASERKSAMREYKRQYAIKHRDTLRAKARQRYLDNYESIRERAKQYYRANREKLAVTQKLWVLKNRERVRVTQRQHTIRNRSKKMAYDKNIYPRVKQAMIARVAGWQKTNRPRHLESCRKHCRKSREALGDGYIKALLQQATDLPFRLIPPHLIEAKRSILKVKRLIKSKTNGVQVNEVFR